MVLLLLLLLLFGCSLSWLSLFIKQLRRENRFKSKRFELSMCRKESLWLAGCMKDLLVWW